MQKFERVYMRTLRHIYDTEKQLLTSLGPISASLADVHLLNALREIAAQSERQLGRIEGIFHLLYLEPRTEPAWVATALLREAWEAGSNSREGGARTAAPLLFLRSSATRSRSTNPCCAGRSSAILSKLSLTSAAASPRSWCKRVHCRILPMRRRARTLRCRSSSGPRCIEVLVVDDAGAAPPASHVVRKPAAWSN